MASGSFELSTSNPYVKGRVSWSSTTNNNENYSNVYVEMKFWRTNTGYTTAGSGTFAVYLNGQEVVNNTSFTITYNNNPIVVSGTVRVYHDDNGSKTITISGDGYTNVFDVYDNYTTAYLDTIPRRSNLTSSCDLTASNNLGVTISRMSSNFTHTVIFWVEGKTSGDWREIKRVHNIGTSTTLSFSDADNEKIFQALDKRSSCRSSVTVQTYNGGTLVGSADWYGTCYNPGGGYVTFSSFTYGDPLPIKVNASSNKFQHIVEFYLEGVLIKKVYSVPTGNSTVTWEQSEVNAMLQATPNAGGGSGEAFVTTYWNNTQIWNPIASGYYAASNGRPPTFPNTFTYKDTNTSVSTVTENDQIIVQSKSNVVVSIPVGSKATAQDYATMKEYVATLNGVEIRQPYSDTSTVTFDFKTVSASSDTTLSVKAVDSRGKSVILGKNIPIIPYSAPTVSPTVQRVNNFEISTTIATKGTFSPLPILTSNKNTISQLEYRYKQTVNGTWSDWQPITNSISAPNYTGTTVTKDFDNLKGWTFEIKVTDKFGSTTATRTIDVGRPILFIDPVNSSIGINKFPSGKDVLDVEGAIKVKKNQYNNSATGAGLQLANSDMAQVNAIYFNDTATGIEGFNFLKTGAPEASTNNADYDNFHILDGAVKLNGNTIFSQITGSHIRLGGELNSSSTGGIYFDIYGNILGQSTAGSGNTWSIKDADNRIKFITPIGKNATTGTEIHSHGGAFKIFQNGVNSWGFWQQGGGAYAYFDIGAGRIKWNGDNATFEFLNINGGYAKMYGEWTPPSARDFKKNIDVYEDSALTLITTSKTYEYHYLEDEDYRKKRLGLIIDDSPDVIISDTGESIDAYAMITLLWKGIQELASKTDDLDRRITMR